MRLRPVEYVFLTLIIIGAINWGLIGFFRFDLIAMLFGGAYSGLSRVVYAIVGIAGLCSLTLFMRMDETEERG